MPLTLFINGLLPRTRDARSPGGTDGGSRIYTRISKAGHPDIEFHDIADDNGEFTREIPATYVGAHLVLRVAHRWYKMIEVAAEIPDYGFFYTAKIAHEFNYWSDAKSDDPEWNSETEYIRASAVKNGRLRAQRYRNRGMKFAYYGILVTAPFVGLLVSGWVGVIAGLAVAAILEYFAPYSIGLKRFLPPRVGA